MTEILKDQKNEGSTHLQPYTEPGFGRRLALLLALNFPSSSFAAAGGITLLSSINRQTPSVHLPSSWHSTDGSGPSGFNTNLHVPTTFPSLKRPASSVLSTPSASACSSVPYIRISSPPLTRTARAIPKVTTLTIGRGRALFRDFFANADFFLLRADFDVPAMSPP
jgi:hypothetical protein